MVSKLGNEVIVEPLIESITWSLKLTADTFMIFINASHIFVIFINASHGEFCSKTECQKGSQSIIREDDTQGCGFPGSGGHRLLTAVLN